MLRKLLLPVLAVLTLRTVMALRQGGELLLDEDAATESSSESVRAASRLMSSVDSFLATKVSSAQKTKLRETSLISALEKRGISLEEQFQHFTLMHAGDHGLLELAGVAEANLQHPSALIQQNAAADPHVSLEDFTQKQADENEWEDEALETFLKLANLNPGAVNKEELSDDIMTYMAVDELLRRENESPRYQHPLSQVDPDKYREWRKRQASMTGGWFDEMMSAVTNGDLAINASQMNELYDQILELSGDFANLDSQLKNSLYVDWSGVEEKSAWYEKLGHGVVDFSKKSYLRLHVVLQNMWNVFTRQADEEELVCANAMKKDVEHDAKSKGVFDQEHLKQKLNDDNKEEIMEEQTEKAMDALEKTQERNAHSTGVLDAETKVLKAARQAILADAETGVVNTKTLKASKESLDDLREAACGEKKHDVTKSAWTVLSTLKALWKKIKKVGKSAAHLAGKAWTRLFPTIGNRGLGGFASALGGGFEEVIDFRNREIGYFTWGGAQLGTDLAAASYGGYIGLASHGNKAGWPLEDYFGGCIFTAFAPGLNFFGLEASAGLSIAWDADSSMGDFTPWVPVPDGIDVAYLGWSVGAGASLPINFGMNYGQAKYYMITSECFDDPWEFLFKGVLNKVCTTCNAGAEVTMISLLRTGCWAAGFPIISDALFFIIWSINELARKFEPEWEQHCSARSTNMRSNVTHMSRIIAQKVEESVRVIHRIRNNSHELSQLLGTALLVNRENLLHSAEIKSLTEAAMPDICLIAPPELNLAGDRVGLPIGRQTKAQIKERVEEMTDGELEKYCKEFELDCDKKDVREVIHGWTPSPGEVISHEVETKKHVRKVISHVSRKNPFGRCKTDTECKLVVENSHCVRSGAQEKMHVRRGTCQCQKNYCYGFKKGKDICKPDNAFYNDKNLPHLDIGLRLSWFADDSPWGFRGSWMREQNYLKADGAWTAIVEGVSKDGHHVTAVVNGTSIHWSNEPPDSSVFLDAIASNCESGECKVEGPLKDILAPLSYVDISVQFVTPGGERISKGVAQWLAIKEIELGSFVKQLQFLTTQTLVSELPFGDSLFKKVPITKPLLRKKLEREEVRFPSSADLLEKELLALAA